MSRLLAVLVFLVPTQLCAQLAPAPLILSRSTFASSGVSSASISAAAIRMRAASPHRVRNALIGGVIGAAAGAVVCTAISNIADDAAVDRFTTCTAKGYLLTGGVGFGVGFLAGWLGSS